MITVKEAVSLGALLLGFKMWHDLISYIHHRERMRAYRYLVTEGMALVRLAASSGLWQPNEVSAVSRGRRRERE